MDIQADCNISECCICFEPCIIIILCRQCKTCKICEKCIISYLKTPQRNSCPCCKIENWRVFVPLSPHKLVLRNRYILRSNTASLITSYSSSDLSSVGSSSDLSSVGSSSDLSSVGSSSDLTLINNDEHANQSLLNVSQEFQLLMDYTSNIGPIHNTYDIMQVLRYAFTCFYYIWAMITVYIIYITYWLIFNMLNVVETNKNLYIFIKCIYSFIIIWGVFKLKQLAANMMLSYNSYRQIVYNSREFRTIRI